MFRTFVRRYARKAEYPNIKAAATPLEPVAVEMWETREAGVKQKFNLPTTYEHPMYTPNAEHYTGFLAKKLPKPLSWPEYDQQKPLAAAGADGLSAVYDSQFGVAAEELGAYPEVPKQFANLRDPHKYWDKQRRREWGEVLYSHDNMVDIWGPGAHMHPRQALLTLGKMFAVLGAVLVSVIAWDPAKHAPWV